MKNALGPKRCMYLVIVYIFGIQIMPSPCRVWLRIARSSPGSQPCPRGGNSSHFENSYDFEEVNGHNCRNSLFLKVCGIRMQSFWNIEVVYEYHRKGGNYGMKEGWFGTQDVEQKVKKQLSHNGALLCAFWPVHRNHCSHMRQFILLGLMFDHLKCQKSLSLFSNILFVGVAQWKHQHLSPQRVLILQRGQLSSTV